MGGVLLCGCDSRPVASVQDLTPGVDVSEGPPRPREGERFESFRERWNAWVEALPAEDRMQPELGDAIERFRQDREIESGELLSDWPPFVLSDARPWNGHWEHIDHVHKAYEEDIQNLIEVVQRPYLGAPIPTTNDDKDRFDAEIPGDWVTAHSLDSVSPLRQASIYLRADAVYLAFAGEQGQAIERFKLLDHLCQRTLELPGMTQLLVELALRMFLTEAMFALVEYNPDVFSDDQLSAMQSILHKQLSTDYRRVFEFMQFVTREDWRLQFHSVDFARTNPDLRAFYHEAAKTYTEGYFSEFLPVIMKPELDDDIPLALLDHQIGVQSRMLDAMLIDLAADPATERMPRIHFATHKHLSGRDASRFVPVFVDTGLWRSQLGFIHRLDYQITNHIVALAIHRHRARHGQWPESLGDIDPDTLPVPATDLYSGEPLRYSLAGGKPRLWALGADRDDDGGRRGPEAAVFKWFALDEWEAMSEEERDEHDGDILLMDPRKGQP